MIEIDEAHNETILQNIRNDLYYLNQKVYINCQFYGFYIKIIDLLKFQYSVPTQKSEK